MPQKLFTRTKKDFHDTVIRLEELGFECIEDIGYCVCRHAEKGIAFRITQELGVPVPEKIIKDIRELVDYNYSGEEKHYQEYEVEDHIFLRIKKIDVFLDKAGFE